MGNRKDSKTKDIAAYSQIYDVAKRIEQKLNGIQCEEAAYEK